MSLARAWRRQLYGASSAALIVPCAMLASVAVLALGGSFSGVGVLGQVFAGPPAPGGGGGVVASGRAGGAGGRGGLARALPVVPVAAVRPVTPGRGQAGPVGRGRRGSAPVSSGGTSRGGGAVVGVVAPIVGGGPGAPVRSGPSSPAPASTGPASPGPTQSAPPPGPSPSPSPSPSPTPVDRIVNAVTPVTQALPAPVGPAATQVVQSVGSSADRLLPPRAGAPSVPGVKLP